MRRAWGQSLPERSHARGEIRHRPLDRAVDTTTEEERRMHVGTIPVRMAEMLPPEPTTLWALARQAGVTDAVSGHPGEPVRRPR